MLEPLDHCPNCNCRDLFVRKDFPQKLGLTIVFVAGGLFLALAASRANFYLGATILLIAVAVDAAMYAFVQKITVCYRCRSEFRDRAINPKHEGFDLSIGEKYRQK